MIDFVSVEEMAQMHDISMKTIRRALERGEIEGAVKIGGKHRGIWQIPSDSAANYKPRRRGRPKKEPSESK